MKKILTIVFIFVAASTFAQEDNNLKIEKDGDLTKATYYHANGTVQQEGTFNAEGELHGTWTSFDINGKKIAVGNYLDGKKVGKWFFWTNKSLKEVDYIDSKIASVNEWKDKTRVALRNR